MGNGKRAASQPGEGCRKKVRGLRPAGPSISDRDRREYQHTDNLSTYYEPPSYYPNPESAGQFATPAAAHPQITPSTLTPTTVSSHHEEYYAAPQATYRGDRSSVSDYTHDAYVPTAEEVMDSATLNRVSMTAAQGSAHGSRHNSRDWTGAQVRPLSLSRVPESPIAEQLWDRMNGYGAASTQSLPPFSTFARPLELTRARDDRNRLVQDAGNLIMGSHTPPPDGGMYQHTLEVEVEVEVEDHDLDIQFPDIVGYPHSKSL
ncbi:hypothetical protein GGTG_11931 [Gaeumannomyces tritici R3-111a-1]|uniref:Uncharacterized protein n=1 Tax=Gaeumannomyces tritici (strain R3-111a-1) TaxID=644352 RepID=J3PEK0_GAET3|nr:hypothetical protein GGTG_11931 [Gaeumannomyces tritici R3-111a-1]EJT70908.1 hypothetical protein GGTG_11931 [Gaeumannomyces tritici R3-111a-1]